VIERFFIHPNILDAEIPARTEGNAMRITDWPATERPRERLLALGAGVLSDAELLAIFLRTGIAGSSAVELARALLSDFGGLAGLLAAENQELEARRGVGQATIALLRAALELARRALADELTRGDTLANPTQVAWFLQLWLRDRPFEVFAALFLDARNRLIVAEELFRGTLTQTAVYPREIVRRALAVNAAGVILAHNHPSGAAEPSTADQVLTQALRAACALVDVRVLDHIIVAGHRTHSFAAHGKL
jgi:DNA repair protein RadC